MKMTEISFYGHFFVCLHTQIFILDHLKRHRCGDKMCMHALHVHVHGSLHPSPWNSVFPAFLMLYCILKILRYNIWLKGHAVLSFKIPVSYRRELPFSYITLVLLCFEIPLRHQFHYLRIH